jgi:3-hydroxyacyl-CoA dehydrogenase
MASLAEGLRYREENHASIVDVDQAIQAKLGIPMGPFRLADLVGLDVLAETSEILQRAYGERFHYPSDVNELVAKGRLGQKTDGGFYNADGTPAVDLGNGPVDADRLAQQVMGAAFLEAYHCLTDGIATAPDIDTSMMAGAGWPVGPMTWADQTGPKNVVRMLTGLSQAVGPRFTPPDSLVALVESGASLSGR